MYHYKNWNACRIIADLLRSSRLRPSVGDALRRPVLPDVRLCPQLGWRWGICCERMWRTVDSAKGTTGRCVRLYGLGRLKPDAAAAVRRSRRKNRLHFFTASYGGVVSPHTMLRQRRLPCETPELHLREAQRRRKGQLPVHKWRMFEPKWRRVQEL